MSRRSSEVLGARLLALSERLRTTAGLHRMDQVIGDVDSVERPIESASGDDITLDHLDAGTGNV